MLVGCCCGSVLTSIVAGSDPKTETVYVEATETVTQPAVTAVPATQPESCMRAIEQAKAMLSSASRIASVTDKQLDILNKAYQAILLKDTRMLNEAADEQTQLDLSLGRNKTEVLVPYQTTMDGLATCQG